MKKSCNNCGNGPFKSEKCMKKSCSGDFYSYSERKFQNWIPNASAITTEPKAMGVHYNPLDKVMATDSNTLVAPGTEGIVIAVNDDSIVVRWDMRENLLNEISGKLDKIIGLLTPKANRRFMFHLDKIIEQKSSEEKSSSKVPLSPPPPPQPPILTEGKTLGCMKSHDNSNAPVRPPNGPPPPLPLPLSLPLPCPFCGGKAEYQKDGNYFIVEHDSWSCPLAKISREVYQVTDNSDAVEWNERSDYATMFKRS